MNEKIESLENQLKKNEELWTGEKVALLQDRSLCNDEAKLQQAKDAAHIKLLMAK